jgi:hypothetical protein
MTMRRKQVTAFVDWNAQIANAKQRGETRTERQARSTAEYVSDKIATILSDTDKTVDLFQVEMRLYYGWHRGLTATPTRVAVERLMQSNDLPLIVRNVRFDWSSPFGDSLLDALDFRLHPRLRIHLPNTLRASLDGGPDREKMVDSALVCDLLCRARTEPENIRLVMAEDDDVVPALYVSERWTKDKGGKTIVARTRLDGAHLSLTGLLHQI